jgi:uncharacterized membrane protein
MWRSNASLARDIERWQASGWVTPEGGRAIAAELAAARGTPRLAVVFAVLGAALFGLAALSFVAANWQAMSKLARMALLISSMAGAYGAAGVLFQRGQAGLAHAAVLLGVALFGANIMLISQMYHIDGHAPDAVLVWAIGALSTGVVLRSKPALALAMGLVALWGSWETGLLLERSSGWAGRQPAVYWPFLIGWAAVTAAIVRERWSDGVKLAAVVLSVWIVSLGYLLPIGSGPDRFAHHIVILLGLAIAGIGAAMAGRVPDGPVWKDLDGTVWVCGLLITACGWYAAQVMQADLLGGFGAWAALGLMGTVATIGVGLSAGRSTLVRLGYAGFAIEVVTVYFKTIGTLMGSAGFFLTAGLMLIALAAIAVRLNRATTHTGVAS